MPKKNNQTYVLYHADCFDGIGAAMAAWVKDNTVKLVAMKYNQPELPPMLPNSNVILVDFTLNPEQMLEVAATCNTLLVLDHHPRAFTYASDRFMTDLPGVTNVTFRNEPEVGKASKFIYTRSKHRAQIRIIYSEHESGALMAWRHFHPEKRVPQIIHHLSDYDLWNFDLPLTRTVIDGLGTLPLDPKVWKQIIKSEDKEIIPQLLAIGAPLRKKIIQRHTAIVDETLRYININGVSVPCVMCERKDASEILSNLSLDAPFAARFIQEGDVYTFSLRSNKKNPKAMNVDQMARWFEGGGGHHHAAGFQIPLTHPLARQLTDKSLRAGQDGFAAYEYKPQ